jgi:hypothetical protein
MQRPQRRVLHTHGGARNAPAFLFGIFLLIGLGLLGGAAFLVVDTRSDIARADKADGSVIALIGERDSDGDTMYYPRVRYVTRSGNPVEFTGSVGSSPAAFDVGEPVAVLYDPAEPEGARIDSFFQLWFAALILGGIGLVFAAIGGGGGLVAWRARTRSEEPGIRPSPVDADRAPVVRAVERTARD